MPKKDAQMEVPDEYLMEIGRIIVCWNSLEKLLDSALIVALSGHTQDPNGKATAIFAHMAVDQKINAFEAMLRLIDKTAGGLGDVFKETIRPGLIQSKEPLRRSLIS